MSYQSKFWFIMSFKRWKTEYVLELEFIYYLLKLIFIRITISKLFHVKFFCWNIHIKNLCLNKYGENGRKALLVEILRLLCFLHCIRKHHSTEFENDMTVLTCKNYWNKKAKNLYVENGHLNWLSAIVIELLRFLEGYNC